MALRSTHDDDDRETAYALWLGVAQRNVSEVSRQLGIPQSTLQRWYSVENWPARAADDDRDLVGRNRDVALRILADGLPDAAMTIVAATSRRPRHTGTDGPSLPRPDRDTVRAATTHLAYLGIVARRDVHIALDTASPATYSDDDLDRYIASGNIAALLAIAAGKPLPDDAPISPPPPGDFTSDQPGGRGVPESPSPVAEQSVFDAAMVLDAVYRDTSEPAPERHYAPGGEEYTEVPQ